MLHSSVMVFFLGGDLEMQIAMLHSSVMAFFLNMGGDLELDQVKGFQVAPAELEDVIRSIPEVNFYTAPPAMPWSCQVFSSLSELACLTLREKLTIQLWNIWETSSQLWNIWETSSQLWNIWEKSSQLWNIWETSSQLAVLYLTSSQLALGFWCGSDRGGKCSGGWGEKNFYQKVDFVIYIHFDQIDICV